MSTFNDMEGPSVSPTTQLAALLREALNLSFCEMCDFVGDWAEHFERHPDHYGVHVPYALNDAWPVNDSKSPRGRALEVLDEWLIARGVSVAPLAPAEAGPEIPDDVARLMRLVADERFQDAWIDVNLRANEAYDRGCVVRVGVLNRFLRAALARTALPAEPPRWLEKILGVMRDKTLPDDVALSEIQDWLTIGGYDVPLRSYDTRVPPLAPAEAPELDDEALLAAFVAGCNAENELNDAELSPANVRKGVAAAMRAALRIRGAGEGDL
jgi:hypothetical protein